MFLRRPSLTIVLIGREQLLRADFRGRGTPTLDELWEQPRPDFDDLPGLVEAALALGPQPGRQVLVLSTDLWTQSLSMALRATSRLEEDELVRALGFEVETLSGTSAFEATIGHREVPSDRDGERSWWVVQARTADRDLIDEIIRRAGSRLIGLAHPGGLPRPMAAPFAGIASDGTGSWQRVELWPDVIACLHGERNQPVRVHLIHADPRQERWHSQEEEWRSKYGVSPHREMLLTTGELVVFGEDRQPAVQENVEKAHAAWLTAWAEQLAAKTIPVPIIRPVVQPMSAAHRLTIGVGLALVIALFCWIHTIFVQQPHLERLRGEAQRLRQPLQMLGRLDQQAGALEKELVELRKQTASMKQACQALADQRQRLDRLLAALAEHQPDDLLVHKIDGSIGQPTIHGVCLNQNLANQLTTRLAHALPSDWQIKETRLKADGRVFIFEVQLQLTGEAPRPVSNPRGEP
jgi:hypothetical protein